MSNSIPLSGWNVLYKSWLSELIRPESRADFVYTVSVFLLCLLVSILFYKLGKWFIYKLTSLLIKKKNVKIVAILKANKFFSYLSYYLPLLVFKYNFDLLWESEKLPKMLGNVYQVAAVLLIVLIINAALNSIVDFNQRKQSNRSKPIRGLVQFVQIILYFLAAVFCIAILSEKSPYTLLAGLGAMSALIMLIFKDSITGLVAGAQLSFNHMLQIGDWISLPGYDVDGEIADITLTSVKVRNWDKSISTVPTYKLVVSDSVKNWRHMQESGIRRISRAIVIDVGSVLFCTPEMLARYRAVDGAEKALKDIDAADEAEAAKNAKKTDAPKQNGITNGVTNLGVFRAYIYRYLEYKSGIRADLSLVVRHKDPSVSGLPLEITCFASTTDTKRYEAIQSDIFEHLIAIAPAFDLKLLQIAGSLAAN
ncbi:MAG: mechanosensitive ion channel family protein [Prevotellaceae bacterium]|jgi:miniconductance mechanosensitive channel|nr:mechanosensitive ion channel family protein [Prevotellaceae bacterium]